MSDGGTLTTLLRQARERAATGEPEPDHRPAVEEDPEEAGEYRAFGEFREGAGFGVDFRLKDGREYELSYAHLYSNDFDPSGVIVLVFTGGERVVIRGKNLRPLRTSLRRRRAAWVRELPAATTPGVATTVVTRIEVPAQHEPEGTS